MNPVLLLKLNVKKPRNGVACAYVDASVFMNSITWAKVNSCKYMDALLENSDLVDRFLSFFRAVYLLLKLTGESDIAGKTRTGRYDNQITHVCRRCFVFGAVLRFGRLRSTVTSFWVFLVIFGPISSIPSFLSSVLLKQVETRFSVGKFSKK